MKTVFELIEANGLTLHGDIEHFAELVRADMTELQELKLAYAECSRQRNKLLNKLKSQTQRTWQGLTDEEAFQICVDCGCLSEDWLTLLDAIEAKLKEKNT